MIKDTYQYELGLGSLSFWFFIIAIIPDSIIYTWIFNNNSRSILSAILYHLCTNFLGEIFISLGTRIQFIRIIFLFLIAMFITKKFGKEKLIIQFRNKSNHKENEI
ncbi:MAG: hypothetical protein ACFFB0_22290 [Promethearchaeota archaeon]